MEPKASPIANPIRNNLQSLENRTTYDVNATNGSESWHNDFVAAPTMDGKT